MLASGLARRAAGVEIVAVVSGKPRPGRFVSARKAPLGEGSALPRYGTAARTAARRSTARRRGSRPRGAPSKGRACAAFPRSSSAAGRRASPRPALRVSPTPRGRGGGMPGRLRNADMGGSERVRAAPISWPRRTCRRSPAPAPPIPLRLRGARRPCVLPGCTGRSAGTVAGQIPCPAARRTSVRYADQTRLHRQVRVRSAVMDGMPRMPEKRAPRTARALPPTTDPLLPARIARDRRSSSGGHRPDPGSFPTVCLCDGTNPTSLCPPKIRVRVVRGRRPKHAERPCCSASREDE